MNEWTLLYIGINMNESLFDVLSICIIIVNCIWANSINIIQGIIVLKVVYIDQCKIEW